jgi:hypothetical protein
MFDLIGDIHGHAKELEDLLNILGYRKDGGVFRHLDRKVIFLGDFIDRGPHIRQVLEIVRGMVESGSALAVMGNHEWNAVMFHTEAEDRPGEFLRPHTTRNIHQIRKTLEQIPARELDSYLSWFRSLPMWLDLKGLRVVHACWDESAITKLDRAIREAGGLNSTLLQSAGQNDSEFFNAVETVLKGKETNLPPGFVFHDKDGTPRTRVRTRWYLPPSGQTYQSYTFDSAGIDCECELKASVLDEATPYPSTGKPLFIGHYWLTGLQPEVLTPNVACLDYSVAKGGFLCAYRWNGEPTLKNGNFCFVRKD